ncbi:MAG: hypothetical protein M0R80_06945 [Proteobacteria bacterium]|jgi:hypothetical protein|nr:hypothetical protein [Pseudomonadota bacterium]
MTRKCRRTGGSTRILAVAAVLLVSFFAASCGEESSPGEVALNALIPRAPADTAVAKIVFVDQLFACACTMTRIENSWKALQSIIGGSQIPVERVHLDKDADEKTADRYDDMASLVVPPGIYFLDSGGALIKMLQGEVTVKQISDVLQTRKKKEAR